MLATTSRYRVHPLDSKLASLRLKSQKRRERQKWTSVYSYEREGVGNLSGIPVPRCFLLMDKLDNRVGEESKHILRLYEFFLVPYTCQVKMRKEWDLNTSAHSMIVLLISGPDSLPVITFPASVDSALFNS